MAHVTLNAVDKALRIPRSPHAGSRILPGSTLGITLLMSFVFLN